MNTVFDESQLRFVEISQFKSSDEVSSFLFSDVYDVALRQVKVHVCAFQTVLFTTTTAYFHARLPFPLPYGVVGLAAVFPRLNGFATVAFRWPWVVDSWGEVRRLSEPNVAVVRRRPDGEILAP